VPRNRRQASCRDALLPPTPPWCGRDHAGLELGDGRHLLQQEFAGRALDRRQVSKADINARLEQPGEEGDRAGKAVDLGDHKGDLPHACRGQCLVQLGAIGAPAALNLCELANDALVAAVQVIGDSLALSLDPKTIVSERLGHSKIGIRLDLYSRVLPNMQEDAATRVDGALEAALHQRNGAR
jgi:hypothetical protein